MLNTELIAPREENVVETVALTFLATIDATLVDTSFSEDNDAEQTNVDDNESEEPVQELVNVSRDPQTRIQKMHSPSQVIGEVSDGMQLRKKARVNYK